VFSKLDWSKKKIQKDVCVQYWEKVFPQSLSFLVYLKMHFIFKRRQTRDLAKIYMYIFLMVHKVLYEYYLTKSALNTEQF
jgi:hypothetical protein